jgi:hypothetical protein
MESTLVSYPSLPSLRDIRDIPPLPWWPLAPGWWLLGFALLMLALAAWHWRAPLALRMPIPGFILGSWRWAAVSALNDLRRRTRAGQDAKITAGELSEILRRIAMVRFGRAACASLTGNAWLDWLAAHDPNGFPWQDRGRVLLVAPYAPACHGGEGFLPALIDAAQAWVTAPDPRRRSRHFLRRQSSSSGREATDV